MRVLIVDESPERAAVLREGLERAGYEVAAALAAPIELLRAVEQVRPDVIIIDTDSPSRDVLEHVVIISRDEPRPIVMFSSDDAPDSIRDAVRAGVSAYVVDGLDAARVKSIVEVAVARFTLGDVGAAAGVTGSGGNGVAGSSVATGASSGSPPFCLRRQTSGCGMISIAYGPSPFTSFSFTATGSPSRRSARVKTFFSTWTLSRQT